MQCDKFLDQTFFGNYMISRVYTAHDCPSSMSGTKVMAQKNILPQIQEMHKSPTGGYRSVR